MYTQHTPRLYCFFVGKSFIEAVKYIFTLPGVKLFLSQRICQDPLENFFSCQRQLLLQTLSCGNCRGGNKEVFASTDVENRHEVVPLLALNADIPRLHGTSPTTDHYCIVVPTAFYQIKSVLNLNKTKKSKSVYT